MVQWPHNVKYCICCSARVTIQRSSSVISFKVCVSVFFCMCVCVLSQRGFGGGYLKQRAPPPCACPLSKLSEEHESLEWHCDEILFCLFVVIIPGHVAVERLPILYGNGLLVDSMPSSSYKRWRITILNSHFLKLKARTQCCSHCLNFGKEHITMATVLRWQNIISIWDTHKGESDPNTRQFRITSCEADILAGYNIEQLKRLQ